MVHSQELFLIRGNSCRRDHFLFCRHLSEPLFSRAYRFKESATYTSHTMTCGVVASNRPTESLASVNSLVFAVIVIINTDFKYLGRELNHGLIASVTSFSVMGIASVVRFFRLQPRQAASTLILFLISFYFVTFFEEV